MTTIKNIYMPGGRTLDEWATDGKAIYHLVQQGRKAGKSMYSPLPLNKNYCFIGQI